MVQLISMILHKQGGSINKFECVYNSTELLDDFL